MTNDSGTLESLAQTEQSGMAETGNAEQLALEVLYSVLDELNEELPEDGQLARDPATILYGKGSALDSIDLVRLAVLYEQRIADVSERNISILDDKAMSEENSPFRTVRTLADFVTRALTEE